MAKLKIRTVKFKKDCMMLLAFFLFFAIVVTECFLAVWLPWHMRREHMWAEQVAQQELIDMFDGMRGRVRKATEQNVIEVAEEAILLTQALDRTGAFMHQNSRKLSPGQCESFMAVLKKIHVQTEPLNKGKAYSRQQDISYTKFLQNMRGTLPDKKQ